MECAARTVQKGVIMAQQSREGLVRKIQKQRKMMNFLYGLSKYSSAKSGKEIYLETEAGTVRTLWYGFEDKTVKPVFFDMHGGGFILMNAEADEAMNVSIHQTTGCKVISIDYALAPEYPFPTAVNQVYAVVKEVHKNAARYGIDPERMAIGGHSAGGNLAAGACIQSVRKGEFRFACQMLDYPPLDLATSPYDKPCPKGAIKPGQAATYDACYINPAQAKDPLVSPVYAEKEELSKLPPTLIILAGYDSLHDEGAVYARLLEEAGVVVELHEFPEEKHGFTYFRSKALPRAMELITGFLDKYLR